MEKKTNMPMNTVKIDFQQLKLNISRARWHGCARYANGGSRNDPRRRNLRMSGLLSPRFGGGPGASGAMSPLTGPGGAGVNAGSNQLKVDTFRGLTS